MLSDPEVPQISGGHMLPLPATTANSNEIVKYVRQYIHHDTGEEYTPQKVKSRSRKVFLSYRSEESWKKTLNRRSDQKQCGFFARFDQPYQDCGNVQLNSTKLVLESLKNIGNGFRYKTDESPISGVEAKNVIDVDDETYDKISQEASITFNSKITAPTELEINGMNMIKERLEKSEKRRISVKAGQPLSGYMQKEQEEQRNLRQAQEKNNLSRDMLDPMESSLAGISNEIDCQNYSDISVKHRYKANFVEKLNCLLLLFNILQNMRIRDLKTKIPFSVDALNQLRKGPLTTEPSHGNHGNRLSRRSMFLPPPRDGSESKGNNRLLAPLTHEGASHADVVTAAVIHNGRKRLQQKFKNSPTSLFVGATSNKWAASNKWDDLVSSRQDSRTENTMNEATEPSYRVVSRMSINGKVMKRRLLNPLQQLKVPADVLPPWQKIAQDHRDQNGGKGELKSKKHDNILEKLKNAFEVTKSNNNRKLKEEIESHVDATRKQFYCLKLGHLREKDLKNMRNEVNDWRRDISLSMAKPPSWYEELVAEQKICQLQDDEVVNEKLQQISKYLDVKPTVSTQAKLCLLVLSLPAYELCTLVMLDSVKFLACKILEMAEHHYDDWLHSRKFINKK